MNVKKFLPILSTAVLMIVGQTLGGEIPERTSKTIAAVLREPLPSEDLQCADTTAEFLIEGPTYSYAVNKTNGAIVSVRAVRDGSAVVESKGPADISVDGYSLASDQTQGQTEIVEQSKQKIVLKTLGTLKDPKGTGPDLKYTLQHDFYNDGVVVSKVTLVPQNDLTVQSGISHRLPVDGRFGQYLHKDIANYDSDTPGRDTQLPEAGQSRTFTSTTSCLEVFSPEAAVAIFTDCGGIHLSEKKMETAALQVESKAGGQACVSLVQRMANVTPAGTPLVLKAGKEFVFRVGISVAPNRLPHPRLRDLRMFVWIGDGKNPYPTDAEIEEVAQLGFTVFQMHRVGTPGEPRPPAGEVERVIEKVHALGMLFIWTANPDFLYQNAQGVIDTKGAGKWDRWSVNDGDGYLPKMDPYCTLLGTCVSAPNGLLEYRMACKKRMLEKYDVDGMYIDDNFTLPCGRGDLHGHPRKPYDCLIELHHMNWSRRQLLREKCPHTVLVGHCGRGISLPVICDFDVQLYGEGRSFASLDSYWGYFNSIKCIPSQGTMWPGDGEDVRCATELAYNFDLLTGGGQYCYLDWRLWPKKFPHAKGVTQNERGLVQGCNLAQYYFGMYESDPYYSTTSAKLFATTTPGTHATVYRNRVWDEYLIPIANMGKNVQKTSLQIRSPETLGIRPQNTYVLFDVQQRTAKTLTGDRLNEGFSEISIPGESLRLFSMRQTPADAPCHLWGGKRISETWDSNVRNLTFTIAGPSDLQETVFIHGAKHGVQKVMVGGEPAGFFFDSAQGLAHGTVKFTSEPVKIEVICSPDSAGGLPEKPIVADPVNREATAESKAASSAGAAAYEWVKVTMKGPFAPRDGAGALVFKDRMWLLGGWNPSDKANFPKTCTNDVWSSANGLDWTLVKQNSFVDASFKTASDWEGRHTAGYVVLNDKMWIVGGDCIQRHYQNDVWNSEDGKSWTRVIEEAPWGPRVLHHTVAFKSKIWVMGGQTLPQYGPAEERFFRDIWTTSDGAKWDKLEPKEPYWTARGMIGGSVVFKDRLWILGGGTYDTPKTPQRKMFNDVWSSDDGVNWQCHTAKAPWEPREYHDVAVFDGRMWMLEGWSGENRKDVWYSSDGADWRELPGTPWKPRHAASVFAYDNALWMVVGNNMESDVWKLVRVSTQGNR